MTFVTSDELSRLVQARSVIGVVQLCTDKCTTDLLLGDVREVILALERAAFEVWGPVLTPPPAPLRHTVEQRLQARTNAYRLALDAWDSSPSRTDPTVIEVAAARIERWLLRQVEET